jgi:two-component system response regulator LytT
MMKINCIAVDDEPLALGLLKAYIQQTPFLNLIGWYSNGGEALHYVKTQKVDLIFLDIKMPKLNGIDLAKILHQNQQQNTRIIFTTAHDRFAIESYRVDAVDYLLKPFGYQDFLRGANKALSYFEQQKVIQSNENESDSIFVRVGHQHVRINCQEILYLEGLKDYVMIHLMGPLKPVMTLATLKSLEARLPPANFMRVQRSYIVALDKVRAVSKTNLWIAEKEINIGEHYKIGVQQYYSSRFDPSD